MKDQNVSGNAESSENVKCSGTVKGNELTKNVSGLDLKSLRDNTPMNIQNSSSSNLKMSCFEPGNPRTRDPETADNEELVERAVAIKKDEKEYKSAEAIEKDEESECAVAIKEDEESESAVANNKDEQPESVKDIKKDERAKSAVSIKKDDESESAVITIEEEEDVRTPFLQKEGHCSISASPIPQVQYIGGLRPQQNHPVDHAVEPKAENADEAEKPGGYPKKVMNFIRRISLR